MIECNSFLRKFESMTSIKVLQVEWRQGLAIRRSLKESRNKTGEKNPNPIHLSELVATIVSLHVFTPKFVEYLFASPTPRLQASKVRTVRYCHHDEIFATIAYK